jgi:hypothetical protein
MFTYTESYLHYMCIQMFQKKKSILKQIKSSGDTNKNVHGKNNIKLNACKSKVNYDSIYIGL